MPFKFDANGAIATTGEGDKKFPIFVHADGREAPFDGDQTVATIARLNGEAKSHRIDKEAAEAKYKPFEGIEDAAAARAALETIKNIEVGSLHTAGKVQEIRDAATKSAHEAVAAATRAAAEDKRVLTETNNKLTADLNNHIIGGAFAGSKFIGEKLAIPSDIAQKFFGDQFKVDGGKLVPMHRDGNPIFSATRHGEIADFEEAFPLMVNAYPHKEMILKGSGASGGGAKPSGGAAGSKTMARAQFEQLDPAARMATMKSGVSVTD